MIKIKISNYRYGRITKRLKNAVNYLNANMKIIIKSNEYPYNDYFDYPGYWNMPKTISYKLTGDEVDWLQEETYEWH